MLGLLVNVVFGCLKSVKSVKRKREEVAAADTGEEEEGEEGV